MIEFLKKNGVAILTILFLLTVGILLLVNPEQFAMLLIRVVGVLLVLAAVWMFVKYFRARPEEAAEGHDFFVGSLFVTGGIFCLVASDWLIRAFPVLAVIYGIIQILLGYYKLQVAVNALRAKQRLWYMKAISAAISIAFGLIIATNAGMTFIGIWVFTGISLIVEGVFDAVALVLSLRNQPPKPASMTFTPKEQEKITGPAAAPAPEAAQQKVQAAPAASAAPEPAPAAAAPAAEEEKHAAPEMNFDGQ